MSAYGRAARDAPSSPRPLTAPEHRAQLGERREQMTASSKSVGSSRIAIHRHLFLAFPMAVMSTLNTAL